MVDPLMLVIAASILILIAVLGWVIFWVRQRVLELDNAFRSQVRRLQKEVEATYSDLEEQIVFVDAQASERMKHSTSALDQKHTELEGRVGHLEILPAAIEQAIKELEELRSRHEHLKEQQEQIINRIGDLDKMTRELAEKLIDHQGAQEAKGQARFDDDQAIVGAEAILPSSHDGPPQADEIILSTPVYELLPNGDATADAVILDSSVDEGAAQFHPEQGRPEEQPAEDVRSIDEQEEQLPNQSENYQESTSNKRRRVEPSMRGGRPRSPEEQPSRQLEGSRSSYAKPEVICWESGQQWYLGTELPEELLAKTDLMVLQDEVRLKKLGEDRWGLSKASDLVTVQWTEGAERRHLTVDYPMQDHLLFRIVGSDQDFGRRVLDPSNGLHLIIVPNNWSPDDDAIFNNACQDVYVALPDCRAYLWDRDSLKRIGFLKEDGKRIWIGEVHDKFVLKGTILPTADERLGPLFVDTAPSIQASDIKTWRVVKTIVVGEEGKGRGRWKSQFFPTLGGLEQPLPEDLTERQAGWYFLRFYDHEDNLLESFDFRFCSGLKSINYMPPPPVPSRGRHELVELEFLHESSCTVSPRYDSLRICSKGTTRDFGDHKRTTFQLLPDPSRDRTEWRVRMQSGQTLDFSFAIERIWWALGNEEIPGEWTDGVLPLFCENFRATSKEALWFRVPQGVSKAEIRVGFDQDQQRRPRSARTRSSLVMPLREFDGSAALNQAGTHDLRLWVRQESQTFHAPVGRLTLQLRCKRHNCDFIAQTDDEIRSHIRHIHLEDIVPELDYEEYVARQTELGLRLPPRIYACSYCRDPEVFTQANNFAGGNALSELDDHFRQKHRDLAPRFRSINDVTEIREKIIHNLPKVYRCRICNQEFTDPNDDDLFQHLLDNLEEHKHQLFELEC